MATATLERPTTARTLAKPARYKVTAVKAYCGDEIPDLGGARLVSFGELVEMMEWGWGWEYGVGAWASSLQSETDDRGRRVEFMNLIYVEHVDGRKLGQRFRDRVRTFANLA